MAESVTAVLLVGGLGTRLRSVLPTTPKAIALVGGESFLDLLLRQLRCQGIRHIVMCTGYLAEQIESHFGDGRAWDVMIEYSREPEALGTAGAIKRAEKYLQGFPDFVVMNGDSFLETDFNELVRFHRGHKGLVSIAVWRAQNAARYGIVKVDVHNRVNSFAEKSGNESPGLINAGVYVFSHGVIEHIPEPPASLERDVFPQLVGHGIYALEHRGSFIDIGTPEDYVRVQPLWELLNSAAIRRHHFRSDQEKDNLLVRSELIGGEE